MGKKFADMTEEQVNICLMEKMNDYKNLMELHATPSETKKRLDYLCKKLKSISNSYYVIEESLKKFQKRNLDSLSPVGEVYGNLIDSQEPIKKVLSGLVDDEEKFLEFFTSPIENDGTTGIRYNDGEKIRYEGINKAITYTVLSTIGLTRKMENRPFEFPKEYEDYTERRTQTMFARDEVTVELSSDHFMGTDLFRYFFTANGEEFNKRMEEIANECENNTKKKEEAGKQVNYETFNIDSFDRYVSESILEDKNDSYEKFKGLCFNVLNVYKEKENAPKIPTEEPEAAKKNKKSL